MLANGPITGGLLVRHMCDNRPCVKPDHLLVGTAMENAHDRVHRSGLLLRLAWLAMAGASMSEIRKVCDLSACDVAEIKNLTVRHVNWFIHRTAPFPSAGLMFDVPALETSDPCGGLDIHGILNQLPVRERIVIFRRFGIGGYPQTTPTNIARIMRVTRQRVHQIEQLAIEKLRILVTKQLNH